MAPRPRPLDIRSPATYVFPGLTVAATAVLAVLYTRYEAMTTATSLCITLFLFVVEPRLEVTMPENFQIPILPIWMILTFWFLYGTEAPDNHFHSLGEMTLRDILWVLLVAASFSRGLKTGSVNILRTATMVLVAVSLFLPTEASVATLMPPWVLSVKIGLTIFLYMALQVRERVRVRGEIKDRSEVLQIVTFQCLSPLFLHIAFLFVPAALLVHVVWTILTVARDRKRAGRDLEPPDPVHAPIRPVPSVVQPEEAPVDSGVVYPPIPTVSMNDFTSVPWMPRHSLAYAQPSVPSAAASWVFED